MIRSDPPSPAVFPAVDLRGGRCVRLVRGARGDEIGYGDDPVAMARRWESDGAQWLHVIDLGGAFGEPDNLPVILSIARKVSIPVQAGGGLRDESRVESLLAGGVRRVILGTRALQDPAFLAKMLERHGPERILLAIDVDGDQVKVRGWEAESGMDLAGGLAFAEKAGVERLLLTAIDRDGTLSGASLGLIRRALESSRLRIVAAGGIGSAADVRAVLNLRHPRLEGVVVGRALYEGVVRLPEVLSIAREYQETERQETMSAAPEKKPTAGAPTATVPDPLLDGIKYDGNGLVPAVVQDAKDGQVLMVAYMDREALRRTIASGATCFYSRSRKEYWVKGATSGNTQKVVRVTVDCDQDCILVVVEQKGVACHTGKRSCFYREVAPGGGSLREIDTERKIF